MFICSVAWYSNSLYIYQMFKDWKNKPWDTSNGCKPPHLVHTSYTSSQIQAPHIKNEEASYFTEHKFWSLPRENKLAQNNNNHLLRYGAALLFPSLLSCGPFLRIVYQSWKWQKEELHPTPQVWRKKPQEFQFCLMGSHISMLLTLKEHWQTVQPGR